MASRHKNRRLKQRRKLARLDSGVSDDSQMEMVNNEMSTNRTKANSPSVRTTSRETMSTGRGSESTICGKATNTLMIATASNSDRRLY